MKYYQIQVNSLMILAVILIKNILIILKKFQKKINPLHKLQIPQIKNSNKLKNIVLKKKHQLELKIYSLLIKVQNQFQNKIIYSNQINQKNHYNKELNICHVMFK